MTMLLDLPSNRAEAWRWSDLSSLPKLAGAAKLGGTHPQLPQLPAPLRFPWRPERESAAGLSASRCNGWQL